MTTDINFLHVFKKPEAEYLDQIPVVNKHVDFNYFFENFMLRNQTCIIKNVAAHWKATKRWLDETKSDINFKYLYKKYGNLEVPTYDCNVNYYNSHLTKKMAFQEYLLYWEAYKASNYSDSYSLLYLKDWHLCNAVPNEPFYKTPVFFSSDWLNEYLINNEKDDYRFVYMGPKGTWTPFHADVFKSYSWSVNIVGKKKWIFLLPGEEKHLMDSYGNMPHSIVEMPQDIKHHVVIQEAGDAIFVPSGWYHQVTNLEDTISINHNWINGCNVAYVFDDMRKHLQEVQAEIADCRDDPEFDEQCQVVLKASYGMNFKEFFEFLEYIAKERLKAEPPTNLSKFDLVRIKGVLQDLLDFGYLSKLNLLNDTEALYKTIDNYLF